MVEVRRACEEFQNLRLRANDQARFYNSTHTDYSLIRYPNSIITISCQSIQSLFEEKLGKRCK